MTLQQLLDENPTLANREIAMWELTGQYVSEDGSQVFTVVVKPPAADECDSID